MKTVEEIVNALPPEDKKRLAKLANAEKKTIEDLVVFILSSGASTPSIALALAGATSAFIFNVGC